MLVDVELIIDAGPRKKKGIPTNKERPKFWVIKYKHALNVIP